MLLIHNTGTLSNHSINVSLFFVRMKVKSKEPCVLGEEKPKLLKTCKSFHRAI